MFRFIQKLQGRQTSARIEKGKRIWGIDFDNLRGWHVHPLRDLEAHRKTDEKTIDEIIDELAEVWTVLT